MALIPTARRKSREERNQRWAEAHVIAVIKASIDGDVFDEFVIDENAEFAYIFWIHIFLKQFNVKEFVSHVGLRLVFIERAEVIPKEQEFI